mgnify:CR=1 FL=1
MKVEYINPFIEASQSVISMMTGAKPELGRVYIRKAPFESDNIAVIVGLTGKIRGQVIISLSKKSALLVASAMMGGMAVKELDDISKSAISELTNMIMGNTATLLAGRGIGIEITPPSLITGKKISFTPTNMQTVTIPLKLSGDSKLEIDISLENKDT